MIISNKLLIAVLVISALILGGLFYFAESQAGQCIRNPYIYGAKTMKNVDCDCTQWSNKVCPAKFYFNDSTFNPVVNYCGSNVSSRPININNLSLRG